MCAASFGDLVFLADAEGEGRVVVEEERRDVVVEDVDDRVGLLLLEPVLDRLERLEDRRPRRVVLLVLVVGEANGRRVRCRNAADDPGHVRLQKYPRVSSSSARSVTAHFRLATEESSLANRAGRAICDSIDSRK
jgi:hypothetical protein